MLGGKFMFLLVVVVVLLDLEAVREQKCLNVLLAVMF